MDAICGAFAPLIAGYWVLVNFEEAMDLPEPRHLMREPSTHEESDELL